MGSYLNPGGGMFKACLRSKIYVDKNGLIAKTNEVLGTEQRFVCVSRPRRFGKSMAANMLAAYYGRGEDSAELFSALRIHTDKSFREHLNQYDVIRINMQEFLSAAPDMDEMLKLLQKRILRELKMQYPDYIDSDYLVFAMQDVFAYTRHPFVILIDEWDCLFREYQHDQNAQKKYLDFLRVWLKDQEYVALAYMTGILPVKKYGSHSALNMFTEYSMINPREMAEFFGFTEEEVKDLCRQYDMDFDSAKVWYNGYLIDGVHMYNPNSVSMAMDRHRFDSYWKNTSSFSSINTFITMNYAGLKDDVMKMLSGEKVRVNTNSFKNDFLTIASKDDALTALIHLGYLGYDADIKKAFVPNYEVATAFESALQTGEWKEIAKAISICDELLDETIEKNEERVAELIELAHDTYTSVLKYNDENSLSCVLTMAYFTAPAYYNIVREMPSGKGFADFVFIPRANAGSRPAMVVELKYNRSADTAIKQIKEKRYHGALTGYSDRILLVGINYDADGKGSKRHTCVIEEV